MFSAMVNGFKADMLVSGVVNLFSEAVPFAAIWIAYRTHVFLRRFLRPEGQMFEAAG